MLRQIENKGAVFSRLRKAAPLFVSPVILLIFFRKLQILLNLVLEDQDLVE
jgi:hypothetical protein